MRTNAAIAATVLLGACATTPVNQSRVALPEPSPESLIAIASICGADSTAGKTFPADLKLSPGMGTGGFKVDFNIPAAQTWFDYGLQLSHAFYHEDAKAAMKRAVAADPTCARCAWGEAWVLGPTLNYRIVEADREKALAAAERAQKLAKPDDGLAKRLADTIVVRYQKADRSTEPAYGQVMLKIANDYPSEYEVAVLASHTLMIPVRQGDRSGLKPALTLIERVLKDRPNNTGAIHYYIHGTEFDGRAEDALPYAKRLGGLAPASSHLVHMPAHTFFRAGLYHEAGLVNAAAIGADSRWLTSGGDSRGATPQYYAHNLSFGLAGALMSGDGPLALKLADHATRVWPGGSNAIARTWVALALYAPEKALAVPVQAKGSREETYRAYARAEVFLRRGDTAAAKAELKNLASTGASEAPERAIARGVIEGRLAMAQGRYLAAADLFDAAAKVQETRLATSWDPPSWWYPVRRSVAAAYLKAGRADLAAAEAEKSLKSWKSDPLANWVLAEAERKQGKAGASQSHLALARKDWRGDLSKAVPGYI